MPIYCHGQIIDVASGNRGAAGSSRLPAQQDIHSARSTVETWRVAKREDGLVRPKERADASFQNRDSAWRPQTAAVDDADAPVTVAAGSVEKLLHAS